MRSHNQQRQARSNLLVSRARCMLHAPTPSEEALWHVLRGGALGVAFKRQVVLGERYIADFFGRLGGGGGRWCSPQQPRG
jgi:very-short-patch-repair endonuclease